ncbi:hypothetical protein RFI_16937 [Reticulomyxa filosa]|uniref:Serine carboxypeptidase S28 family protein n=1 Tax=Reticulomyxa filosa TaxID=46433 RepID=X6N4N6_RETFI|nr:hypothetical protein RFI_16937 [Reticulomyxa filosa]|eukprot:ETO20282.1 hypothetical protein RFI_16937 [Reticulomyxa filosa]
MRQAILAVLGLFILTVWSQIPPPETYYYEQKLDHFNPQDTRTFKEKYLVCSEYWKQGGPIFFYSGNEGEIESFYYNTGFMFDIAPQYYGSSLPFGDDSFTPENLRYLTIELAVADYAQFLTDWKSANHAEKNAVVVFGGSYGGILAAACRIHKYKYKYNLYFQKIFIYIYIFSNIQNPLVFFNLVTNDYNEVNAQCPEIVRQGYAEMISLAAGGQYNVITDVFQLCSPVQNEYDVTYLQLWARNAFLTMAMVDYPYSANFMGSLPAWPVNVSCDILLNYQGYPMQALANAAGMYYNASANNTLECFNITAEFIECADQTGCGLGNDAIAWDYQMCTEIVYGQDTNNVTDMFPPRIWELQNLTEYCQPKYGVTPEPSWMQIHGTVCIFLIFCSLVYFIFVCVIGGGYLTPPGPDDMPTVIIPSGAHHLDLRESNVADPPDVTAARATETQYISSWLEEYQNSLADGYVMSAFQPVRIWGRTVKQT